MNESLQLQILMWVCVLVLYQNGIPLISKICAGAVAAICIGLLIAGFFK